MTAVTVKPLARDTISDHIDTLAELRIAVFAEWPYLYAGDAAYEADYLAAYLNNEDAFIAGAFDGQRMVGACTASPLTAHHAAFAEPLRNAGFDPSTYFYFGESVLLPNYRGQGIGGQFFALRENEARRQGFDQCIFTAVIRQSNHPARPVGYVPLDRFWTRRGYAKIENAVAHFAWRDKGEPNETSKPMAYWIKRLAP